ncbi:hypothetical protein BH20ACT9_BH20ACT9_01020 [soil metagenome]
MDVEKLIFRTLLAAVAVTAVVGTVSSLPDIKRYVAISRM